MRLPSIEQLARTAFAAARRFPAALTCAFVSALSASLLADSAVDEELLTGVLYAASLGIPLFIAITLTALSLGVRTARDWHLHGSTGDGFFHLHFHVGHHRHDEADHQERDTPGPESGSEKRHPGTVTMTFGMAFAPSVEVTEKPVAGLDDRVRDGILDPAEIDSIGRLQSARAPPV